MLSASSISYAAGKKKILEDVSVNFQPGKFSMILGPNGSGKTTFLKIFSGEIHNHGGTVLYEGLSVAAIRKSVLAMRRAVMSQHPELNFPLAVEEVVLMGRYPHFDFTPSVKDIEICEQVIERMNLQAFRERNYLTLSGGEKQRVHFARVLAQVWEQDKNHKRYLILDEPLTSLDVNYQHEFLDIARSFINENTVVIAVIHDINLALQYADHLIFLKEGKLVGNGNPEDVVTESLLEMVFGVQSTIISNPVTHTPLVIFSKQAF